MNSVGYLGADANRAPALPLAELRLWLSARRFALEGRVHALRELTLGPLVSTT